MESTLWLPQPFETTITDMTRSPANHSVELFLPNEIGYERVAMECSAALARMHGCPAERVEDLKTAVAEAAINAMQHGNRGRPGSRVTVTIEVLGETIQVSVTDEGDGITGETPEPDIERAIETGSEAIGFGLFLIRNLVDRVDFGRLSGGGHVVRMAMAMKPGRAPKAA
jgi:serine/threonine-protein kinase RsbW